MGKNLQNEGEALTCIVKEHSECCVKNMECFWGVKGRSRDCLGDYCCNPRETWQWFRGGVK